MTDYPEDFPLDALGLVTRAVKSGDYSDVAALAHAAWVVQGFAMAHLIGPGAAPSAGAGAPAASPIEGRGRRPSRAKAVEQLEAFVEARRSAPEGAAAAPLPIPWELLLDIATKLIRDLVARRAG